MLEMNSVSSQKTNGVTWDYTDHASHYDKRADYSEQAVRDLIMAMDLHPGQIVADIGAGTGKLTKELLKAGLKVKSVEPNDAMRSYGIRNTEGLAVIWSSGNGEETGLPSRSANAAFFGSSFNVVDQVQALDEVCRILVPNGWFACMWNHRNLDDPIQVQIETIIKSTIPAYSYGSRRENPTTIIDQSQRFSTVQSIEGSFDFKTTKDDIVTAWKSHATLRRQAQSEAQFNGIIAQIGAYLDTQGEVINVPYTTRIFFARMK